MCKVLAFSWVAACFLAIAVCLLNMGGIRYYMVMPPLIALFTTMIIFIVNSQRYIAIAIYIHALLLILTYIVWSIFGSFHDLQFFDQQHSLALVALAMSISTMILTIVFSLFNTRASMHLVAYFHCACLFIMALILFIYICIAIARESSGMSKQQTMMSLSYFVSTLALHSVVIIKMYTFINKQYPRPNSDHLPCE